MLNDVTFKYSFILYFLAVVPLMIFWYWRKLKSISPDVAYSSLRNFEGIKPDFWISGSIRKNECKSYNSTFPVNDL